MTSVARGVSRSEYLYSRVSGGKLCPNVIQFGVRVGLLASPETIRCWIVIRIRGSLAGHSGGLLLSECANQVSTNI